MRSLIELIIYNLDKRSSMLCKTFKMCVLWTVVASEEVRNIAVISGSNAIFSCVIHAPGSEVCWFHQTVSRALFYLYRDGKLTSNCDNGKCDVTFSNETGMYTLTINSVQHHDAGFYACRICRQSEDRGAQLVVIESTNLVEGMKM